MKYLAILLFLINTSYADVVLTKPLSTTYNEKTLIVAVIDTGFDFGSTWSNGRFEKYVRQRTWFQTPQPQNKPKMCKFGHKSFTDNNEYDQHGHGTHVAGIIAQNAGNANYCMVAIKYYSDNAPGSVNLRNSINALQYAYNIKADIINYSGGGPEPSDEERNIIEKLLDRGTTLVFAAGNEHQDIDIEANKYYPASYDPRIIVVGSMKYGGKGRLPSSNYGKTVDFWEIGENVLSFLPDNRWGYMTGTSQATAVRTGKIVKKMYQKK